MRDGAWLNCLHEEKAKDRPLATSQAALGGYFVSGATELGEAGQIVRKCPGLE